MAIAKLFVLHANAKKTWVELSWILACHLSSVVQKRYSQDSNRRPPRLLIFNKKPIQYFSCNFSSQIIFYSISEVIALKFLIE